MDRSFPVMLDLDVDHFLRLDATVDHHENLLQYYLDLLLCLRLLDHYVIGAVQDGNYRIADREDRLFLQIGFLDHVVLRLAGHLRLDLFIQTTVHDLDTVRKLEQVFKIL